MRRDQRERRHSRRCVRGVGGKAFVAGTDIAQFAAFESGADGVDYEDRIATFVGAVASLEVPTIAVVEGWAVGGGMAIASVCDFRIDAWGTFWCADCPYAR